MKLIQLNMANGRLLPPLLRFLKREQADIICFQELEEARDIDWHLKQIKDVTGLTYHVYSPLSGYDIAGSFFEVGDCILSRYPIETHQIIPLHGAYDGDWKIADPDFNNYRTLQSATVTVDGTAYHILNYYGYHISGSKQGNDVTMGIMNTICDHIDTLDGPVIFATDTNLAPDSPSMQRLNTTLRNLCLEYDVTTTRNFIAKRLTPEVVDYIFVSPDLVVTQFDTPDDIVSDHQALIVTI